MAEVHNGNGFYIPPEEYLPKPPAGVDSQTWYQFLKEFTWIAAEVGGEALNLVDTMLREYSGQAVPLDFYTQMANVLTEQTGVDFSLYAHNPQGLVNFYLRTFGKKKSSWLKYLIPILIIGSLVIVVILLFKKKK